MNPLDTVNNPSMLHAAIVHFPVVLATLGLPLLLASAVFEKNRTLRMMTLLTFVLLTVACIVAEESGEGAYEHVPNDLPQYQWEAVDEHERLGELMKFFGGATAILVAISFVPTPVVRKTATLAAAAGAIASSILVAVTAHQGGHLVYEYGIGTVLIEDEEKSGKEKPEEEEELVAIKDFTPAEAEAVSYTNDIVPLMQQYCTDCHEDGGESEGGWDATTVANMLMEGKKAGAGVIPGDPDNSSVVKYIRGELKPRMPKRKPALSVEELHVIRMWIAAGAKDDTGDAVEEAPAADPFAAPEETPEPEAPATDPFAVPEETPAPEAPATDPFAAPAETPVAEEPMTDPFAEPEASSDPETPAVDPFAPAEEVPAPEPPATDPFAAPAEESEPETPMTDPFAAPVEEPTPEPEPESASEPEPAAITEERAAEPTPEPAVEEQAPEPMPEASPEAAPAVDPFAAEPPMDDTPEPEPSPVPGEAESEADPFVMPKEEAAVEESEPVQIQEVVKADPAAMEEEPREVTEKAATDVSDAVEMKAVEEVPEENAPADEAPVEEAVSAEDVPAEETP